MPLTLTYVAVAAAILVIAYLMRGPKLAIGTQFALSALHLGLIVLITRSMP